MGKVVDAYLTRDRSEDDQLLIDLGLMDEHGSVTTEGWNLVKEVIFSDNKPQLLKIVKDLGIKPDEE